MTTTQTKVAGYAVINRQSRVTASLMTAPGIQVVGAGATAEDAWRRFVANAGHNADALALEGNHVTCPVSEGVLYAWITAATPVVRLSMVTVDGVLHMTDELDDESGPSVSSGVFAPCGWMAPDPVWERGEAGGRMTTLNNVRDDVYTLPVYDQETLDAYLEARDEKDWRDIDCWKWVSSHVLAESGVKMVLAAVAEERERKSDA